MFCQVLAAKRSGVKCIILPAGNKADFTDLPDEVREGLEVHYAATYEDVFSVALDNGPIVSETETGLCD